jgi:serine/threonine protein kinase
MDEAFAAESLSHVLKLIQTLSKALLFLHLGCWLHKGIRSDNILFFAEDISDVNLCEPYIGGFEYSRTFAVKRLTQNVGDDKFENLYRHPDHQGLPLTKNDSTDANFEGRRPFSYEADLYSFGVLMMEIGLWSTASQVFERSVADNAHEGKGFREVFLDTIPGIKVRMGDAFAEATSLCLKSGLCVGGTGQPETIQEAFYLSVVRALNRCFL